MCVASNPDRLAVTSILLSTANIICISVIDIIIAEAVHQIRRKLASILKMATISEN